MEIAQVKLKGFRNFKDATIDFADKTLLIGANDIGKTNLIYALRILLDKSLSEVDIEPSDSDFYAYEETHEFTIFIKFVNADDDCVRSQFKGMVSDDGEMFLQFKATRDPETNKKEYEISCGHAEDELKVLEERFYRRVVHLKFIGSNRDLFRYIAREKKHLLQEAKQRRSEEEVEADARLMSEVKGHLRDINTNVGQLNFVKNATGSINRELMALSFHHTNQEVVFDVGASDPSQFIDGIQIGSKANDKSVVIGGDGKNNQVFLALWAARNEIQEDNPSEVVFYCIEEPEAHLHPHQQRKLAEYLSQTLKSQIFITTHSPQIVAEFSPNSIVRLYAENNASLAANDGCSEVVEEAFDDFGYRMSIIAAEAFFANVVFLVEGPSEVLFYKALAKALSIDLDRLNISILMVDGVGFEVYVQILTALDIPWVIRTDNDIFKIPKRDEYRYAGIERGLGIYREFCSEFETFEHLIETQEELLRGFNLLEPPEESIRAAERFIEELENFDIYVAGKDLETDLISGELREELEFFFERDEEVSIREMMNKRKATFMFRFLKDNSESLTKLENDDIAAPLLRCKEIAEDL